MPSMNMPESSWKVFKYFRLIRNCVWSLLFSNDLHVFKTTTVVKQVKFKDYVFMLVFACERLREKGARRKRDKCVSCLLDHHCVHILWISSHNAIWIKPEQILLENCMEQMWNKGAMLYSLVTEQWPCYCLICSLQLISFFAQRSKLYCSSKLCSFAWTLTPLFDRFKQLIKESAFVF